MNSEKISYFCRKKHLMRLADSYDARLLVGELLSLILFVAASMWLLPWVEAVQTSVSFVVVYGVVQWLYGRCRFASTRGRVVLLFATLWLAVYALLFLYDCTIWSDASFQYPFLLGDALDYYEWALAYYDGSSIAPNVPSWGFPAMIVLLWMVFGLSLIWPVMMNVLVTLLTIVLAGVIAARVMPERARLVSVLAMGMISVHGYFMSQGAQMLKDPWIYLAVTLLAYSLVPGDEKTKNRPQWQQCHTLVCYAAGCLILVFVRAKYINFMFIALALLALASQMRQWRLYAHLFVITLLAWLMALGITEHYTFVQQVGNVTGNAKMAEAFVPKDGYAQLLGDYFSYPWWRKVLFLPFTCAAQWLIPFPWLPAEELSSWWIAIMPRLRLGWYVLSGVFVYACACFVWRRSWSWRVWALFPLLCFAGIAYMTAGTVSRYILPFQPWFMSIAACGIIGRWRGRHFRYFMLGYITLMAGALIVCYMMVH